MKILAVSNHADTLAALSDILEHLFPDAGIVPMTDPLMAGKYAFHNHVDILLADTDMKRMDGIHLIRFVRQEQPAVRAYLLGAAPVPSALPENPAGYIAYPFRADAVAGALHADLRLNGQGKTDFTPTEEQRT